MYIRNGNIEYVRSILALDYIKTMCYNYISANKL